MGLILTFPSFPFSASKQKVNFFLFHLCYADWLMEVTKSSSGGRRVNRMRAGEKINASRLYFDDKKILEPRKMISPLAYENIDFRRYLLKQKQQQREAWNAEMWMKGRKILVNKLWELWKFFFATFAVVIDYSDGNGNVSGGESEDEGKKDREGKKEEQHVNNSQSNEIPLQTHHEDHNEIEKATTETTTQPALNLTFPCDSDRGGCDHECQMVKYYYDPEPIIQCSCYNGFNLDESDGRRCHGEKKNLLNKSFGYSRSNEKKTFQTSTNVPRITVASRFATTCRDPTSVRAIPGFKLIRQTTRSVSVSWQPLSDYDAYNTITNKPNSTASILL